MEVGLVVVIVVVAVYRPHHVAQGHARLAVSGDVTRGAATGGSRAYRRFMTERQPYEVVERYPEFELRRYPSHAVAEVPVHGSFGSTGNQAFRALFKYVTGHNESAGSIAMTAPVVQESPGFEKIAMTAPVVQTEADGGEHVVAFVLPASLTAATAPVPTDPRVRVRQVPERIAAAVRYSGRWSASAYRRHLTELEAAIGRAGLVATGLPRYARFDPPFTPWFLRRNEVVQDVVWPEGG
ncbi:SOUL family heme-binding protein [Dietzia natronolimnaea]|uniref:SOUL family heme-binding protein n=1 Tax=Dietzia natronolimnaea TaxID=161920 RepID=UPI003D0E0739